MDLVGFLRARLDEDERDAKMATPDPWVTDHPTSRQVVFRGHQDLPDETVVAFDGDFANDTDPAHIARWNPSRVLAEVEAKRRIIDLHHEYDGLCTHCVNSANPPSHREEWPCETVRLLALPYADHPDFDPAWRS